MTTTALERQFTEYWSRLTPGEKESLLMVAKNYVQLKERMEPLSIEQYNKEIGEAMSEIDAGEFYSQEEVEEASKKWLNGK